MNSTVRSFGSLPSVRAVRAAAPLLRRTWFPVLITMLVVQGVLVWLVIPVLNTLMRAALNASGVDGLNQTSILDVLGAPLAVLALVGFALVATVFALAELTVFSVIAQLGFDGERPTPRAVLHGLRAVARKVCRWQGLVLIPYLLLLLPLSHVGVTSVLTEHIAIPKFVSGELTKTTAGTVLYVVVIAVIAYAALRFALSLSFLTGGSRSVLAAMGRSFTQTWRSQGAIALVLLAIGGTATITLLLCALIGAGVVALVPTPAMAGTALGVLDILRFLALGFAAALAAFFLVALARLREGGSLQMPPRRTRRTGRATVLPTACAVLVIAAAVLLAAPRVVADAEALISAPPAGKTIVIGHRGYPDAAVENSLEGLTAAAAAGADMVELDIQETKDGGLVVLHDTTLQRLAGDPRAIYDLTTAEAEQITLRQGDRTAKIPTLDQFVRTARGLGIRLLVEVKPHGHEAPDFAAHVVAAMDRLDPDRTDMIQSLDHDLITRIRTLDPERATAYVVGLQLGDLPRTGADAIVIEDWSYDSTMLATAHAQRQLVYVWTVNDPSLITDYLNRGVDGIITDNIETAVALRQVARDVTNPVSRYLQQALRRVALG